MILGFFACLSLGLVLWQWLAGRAFPLHRRVENTGFFPAVTLLKPLHGADATTGPCLRSWLEQTYPGPTQILFGVADESDPAAAIVRRLLEGFPQADARLVVCAGGPGTNPKLAKLAVLETQARHGLLVVSDADVRVPPGFLAQALLPFRDPRTGLATCLYRLAQVHNAAMGWEAIAVNADFWSQVLQARSLRPLDFALGAVMMVRQSALAAAGGFAAFGNYLADDFQLGRRVAALGLRVELSPVVVDCHAPPLHWGQVWNHQLRWARTIRACRPVAYFFTVLSHAGFWALLWVASVPNLLTAAAAALLIGARVLIALDLQRRLTRESHGSGSALSLPVRALLVPLKDLLQTVLWALAFLGNRIVWQGQPMRLGRGGTVRPGR